LRAATLARLCRESRGPAECVDGRSSEWEQATRPHCGIVVAVTTGSWTRAPSTRAKAALVIESVVEAAVPSLVAGLIVGLVVGVGAGVSTVAACWIVLWAVLSIRAIRSRAWQEDIHVLVIRNRWWTYRLSLTTVEHVRIGSVGGGQGPQAIVLSVPGLRRSLWHRRRGLPIDATAASGNPDLMNATLTEMRKMVDEARRRARA
jgi:hypothetical protein